jgi:hypothetical protein
MNNATLKTLKTFAAINNGIVLKKGKPITTISPAMNILGIHHTPAEADFAVYDLNGFLNVLSLTSESRVITVNERTMNITDGKTKLRFFGSSPDVIVTPPDDTSSLTEAEYSNEFTITSEQLKQLMTACAVLNAKYVVFRGDGSSTIQVETEADYADSNSFQTEFDVTNGAAVVAKLDRSTLKIPTDSDYKIAIGDRAVRFLSDDSDYYVVRAA